MNKKLNKNLIDFTVSKLGYSGIPQDTRRIFGMLANQVDFFVESNQGFKTQFAKSPAELRYFEAENLLSKGYSRVYGKELNPVDWKVHKEYFWSGYFSKGISREVFESIEKVNAFTREMPNDHSDRMHMSNKLDTRKWDNVIFPMPTNCKVSAHSRKIIRHHDSIPIMYPAFVKGLGGNSVEDHWRSLNPCAQETDTLFVCNSEMTRQELLSLYPKMNIDRVKVIPCSMGGGVERIHNSKDFIMEEIQNCFAVESKISDVDHLKKSFTDCEYILTISNIDPKKNYDTLISAWEKAKKIKKNLKLIMVSKPEWDFQPILNRIKPYVERGDIIHLENISEYAKALLLSNASAFIFPSLIEGFGLGILEAASCHCPVIASNIPIHKWVMGDNLYSCDPLDSDAFSQKIIECINSPDNNMINAAFEYSKRYRVDVLAKQWQEILDK